MANRSFMPVQFAEGKTQIIGLITSSTVAVGDALTEDGTGLFARSVSGDAEVPFVAMEAVTTSAAGREILALHTDGVRFDADTAGTTATSDVGESLDLTDHDTVNQAASVNDVFFCEQILGATRIRGFFIRKTE